MARKSRGGCLLKIGAYIFLFFFSLCAANGTQYACIVMDMKTGAVLEAENADSRRYPASLTKKMTLYLLFEALQRGKISLDTLVSISKEASRQPPSRLGLRVGEQVPLVTLLKGLVTRSANDAAMAIAKVIGGSTMGFVRLMNRKARELGMRHTTFRNPSGLSDVQQVTTARDMAILARALYRDFPEQYHWFKMKSFSYRGQVIHNHNHLLGKVQGLDGIKTGYTNASGYNLSACAARGGRRLITIVMGGPSRHWRDKRVSELFEKHFNPALLDVIPTHEVSFQKNEGDSSLDNLISEAVDERDVDESLESEGDSSPTSSQDSPKDQWVKTFSSQPNKKQPSVSTGIQVGGTFTSELSAILAAQRVAKFSGAKMKIKPLRKGDKTFYLARVVGLAPDHAKAVCHDLSSEFKTCKIFTVKES